MKEEPTTTHLPYVEGDKIEFSNDSEKFSGVITKITTRFTTILDGNTEIIVSNRSVLEGSSIIIKKSKTDNVIRYTAIVF